MHLIRMACLVIGAVALAGAGAEPGAGDAAKARRLMNSGLVHERLGQQQDALADFTAALEMKALSAADRVRAIFDCGVALDALGRSDQAIADYSEAIRLDPRFAPALNNRANAYRRLGQLREAKRDYLAALAAGDAGREYPYFGLGQIAVKLGDFDAARDFYRKALTANPAFLLAAQSLTALNHATRDPIVLRPPEPKPIPARDPQKAASVTPAAFVHFLAKRAAPEAARADPPEPPLRLAIVDAGPAAAIPAAKIQLGAFRDQAGAAAGWNKIAAASEGALQGFSPIVLPVDLPGKGRLWRLRTAVGDKTGARRLCAALAAKGLACMMVNG
jgi:tetratricopeptide (TPR) repeat protein